MKINEIELTTEQIKQGLADGDWRVRTAAMKIATERGIVAYSRTFEPPTRVYKQCTKNVIVEAHIPDDAHIRGSVGHKCRASKAIITAIYGTVMGENIGISIYDLTTVYRVGDTVEIQNFNFSNDECAAGYHFFCTREEAERYKP